MQAANLGGRSRSDLDQQAVVLAAMINPVSQLLPPSTAYLKRLLKGFIQHLEDQQADLSEQLLRVHTELLMSGNQSQQVSMQQGPSQCNMVDALATCSAMHVVTEHALNSM